MTPLQQEGLDHIARDTLLRLVDGECKGGERSQAEHHLATCQQCRHALGRIQQLSGGLSALLNRADGNTPAGEWQPPLPKTRSRHWGLAIAAALSTLLLVGIFTPPLRAWIVERLSSVVNTVGEVTEDNTGVRPSPVVDSTGRGGNLVVFTPESDTFNIELSAGAKGRIEIHMNDRGSASTTVTEGVSPEIIILPSGLRVLADSGSAVVYRIMLPASVHIVDVRAGNERVATFTPGSTQGANRWTFELPDSR